MRLISGTAGGIPLAVPKHDLRPTTDRVREAVFSMLGEAVPGARVLDLFAGTGAYALEALSRGAARAVLVEQHRAAAEVIRRNAEKAKLTAQLDLRAADVRLWLKSATGPFDLIFADPPYRHTPADLDWPALLLADPQLPTLLAPDGLLVLESLATGGPLVVPAPWVVRSQRDYGSTRITFLQLAA
jgi:16S rRNA (guanine966-N2)-methyltransferase